MQISEEEKKAIDKLNSIKVSGDKEIIYNYEAGTILNLIEKQNKKIEDLENLNKHQSKDISKAVDYTFELNKELEIAEKMTDEMAKDILKDTAKLNTFWCNGCFELKECPYENKVEQCIKEYFRKKVEE